MLFPCDRLKVKPYRVIAVKALVGIDKCEELYLSNSTDYKLPNAKSNSDNRYKFYAFEESITVTYTISWRSIATVPWRIYYESF